jgi:hypothetical protein
LQATDKILFDIPPAALDLGKSEIKAISFIPEYKTVFKLITKNK